MPPEIPKKEVDIGNAFLYLTPCLNGLPAPAARASRTHRPDDSQCGGGLRVHASSEAPCYSPSVEASEAIHLGSATTHVPDELLEAPFESDRRHVMVDLAGFLLDRHLRRLVAMRNPLELRLARLLGRLQKSSGQLELGFARMSDYVTERLGISIRRMVELLKMDRRLEGLPRSAEAFASGKINASQLRALLRIMTPETEGEWLEKAARLNVRLLEREVRSAVGGRPGEWSG